MRGRPTKFIAELNRAYGLVPLKEHWREINRHERALKAWKRSQQKLRDKKRPKCRCDAYKFPHRAGGGLCRYPDPPAARWQERQAAEIADRAEKFRSRWGEPTAEQTADLAAMTTKPARPYRNRYAGIVKQICRNNGLHPIHHKALIAKLMPQIKCLAKDIKRGAPQAKYRNMKIIDEGYGRYTLQGVWTTAGPTM